MKRTIFTAILIFIILFQFTSCENTRDIVHVRNTETEIIFFSQREVQLKLEVLIEDNDKEEIIYIDKVSCSENVTKIKISDLPGINYFDKDAKISSVKYEIISYYQLARIVKSVSFCVVLAFGAIAIFYKPKRREI